ncbi:hypothetical protein ABEY41_21645 [Peribacillus butanolivorans]|uniref:hypothetical protein n=1 Tax=Peribacillus butanolivorans TaxID=421767 RepID=UPI003D2755DD
MSIRSIWAGVIILIATGILVVLTSVIFGLLDTGVIGFGSSTDGVTIGIGTITLSPSLEGVLDYVFVVPSAGTYIGIYIL